MEEQLLKGPKSQIFERLDPNPAIRSWRETNAYHDDDRESGKKCPQLDSSLSRGESSAHLLQQECYLLSLILSSVYSKNFPVDSTPFRDNLSLPPPQEMSLKQISMGQTPQKVSSGSSSDIWQIKGRSPCIPVKAIWNTSQFLISETAAYVSDWGVPNEIVVPSKPCREMRGTNVTRMADALSTGCIFHGIKPSH